MKTPNFSSPGEFMQSCGIRRHPLTHPLHTAPIHIAPHSRLLLALLKSMAYDERRRRQTPGLTTPMSAAHLYWCLGVGSDVTQ
jgi:hypothetical protein